MTKRATDAPPETPPPARPEIELPEVTEEGPSSPILRTRKVQTCGMCNAYLSNAPGSMFGACAARPPLPLLVNVIQDPLTGKPRPIVDGYRPPVGKDTVRCRDLFQQIDVDHPSLAMDFATQGPKQ